MTPDARLVALVTGLFLAGAGLLRLAQVRRPSPAAGERRDWVKYGVYVAVINALWGSAYLGWAAAAAMLGLIVVAGTVEIFRVMPSSIRLAAAAVAAPLFATALGSLLRPTEAWQGAFSFVVLVTAATDAFAQLSGRLLGRRKLCPRLSPQKTVAGLWGGLAMAVLIAMLAGFLLPGAHGVRLALVGLATAVGAVAGDLLFSAIKRASGVKDFSGLLPAHGGVLDRFDSLLLAAPLFQCSRSLLLT